MKYNEKLLFNLIEIAIQAGREVMQIYSRDFSVEYKDDHSPLTEADMLSNEVITGGLKKLGRQYPILSEESKTVPYHERKSWKNFWLVDPIDGTKEFIRKNGEFTVNIALIENGRPVIGVVYAPAVDTLYYGMEGGGAYRVIGGKTKKLPVVTNNPAESGIIRVVASKSHLNEETAKFIEQIAKQYPECSVERISKGSSLKLCMAAEGSADIYPRIAPTMEWDTAAAQCIAEASGKGVYKYDTFPMDNIMFGTKIGAEKLVYNKEDLLNPYFIVI